MTLALTRSLLFSLATLVLMTGWEALTFEFPREPQTSVWNEGLILHATLVGVIALGAFTGGIVGFYFFPKGRSIKVKRLALLGAIFALIVFFGLGPIVMVGGVLAVFVASFVLAAILAQTVGRLFSQNGA